MFVQYRKSLWEISEIWNTGYQNLILQQGLKVMRKAYLGMWVETSRSYVIKTPSSGIVPYELPSQHYNNQISWWK